MLTATPARSTTIGFRRDHAHTLRERAGRRVAADSTAMLRIMFGLLVTYSSIRFLARGWVTTLWLAPSTHLTYRWFEWVRPAPGNWMYLVPLVLAACGICIATGWHHRLATTVFLFCFAWTELIEATLYLNHYWFVTLLAVLMLVLPVHQHWSLDARAGRVAADTTVPVGLIWVFRAQLAVVYMFAGIAKLNADWLLRAQPLELWLADRAEIVLVGGLLDTQFIAYAASWGAAIFDLTIVGWMCWHRSRRAAWITLCLFHAVTGALFQIGVFPIVMALCTLIFFAPDWPRSFAPAKSRTFTMTGSQRMNGRPAGIAPLTLLFLTLFGVAQISIPLRHYAIESNVRWSEEGYYGSWRVMLTEKAGYAEFRITDRSTGTSWVQKPESVLTDWQTSHVTTRPDLLHATAWLIADELQRRDPRAEIEIRADVWVSMNGRPAERLLDETVDLLQAQRGNLPRGWILPGP